LFLNVVNLLNSVAGCDLYLFYHQLLISFYRLDHE
jgi:hypothetical protein